MKIQWRAGTMLAPVPVVAVTCGTLENPNIITVAWTGILNSDPPKTYVSIRKERYSHKLISETRTFVINLPSTDMIRAIDYCGVRSGSECNKFKDTGFICEPALSSGCPSIAQAPISIECKVCDIVPLGSHDMFIADIVAVNVEETLIVNDKLHIEKAKLTAYAHGTYFALGRKLNTFGFSVRKKKKSKNAK